MILSFIGNHTFAVVRGAENYDTIEYSFRDVLSDINRVIERIHFGGGSSSSS